MEWKLINRFVSEGQAFLPINIKNKGECIQLYFKDGTTEILDMRSVLFLKKVLMFFGTSLTASRRRYGELIGKRQLIPVVCSYGFTLIPYHVRHSVGRQSCDGWFIGKEIRNILSDSNRKTIIQLTNHEITVLHSKRYCLDQLKNAAWIEQCYREIHEPHRIHRPLGRAIL